MNTMPAASSSLTLQGVDRILVIVFDNIGDVIFTSILFDRLKEYTHLRIGVWSKEYTAQVAHLLPGSPQVFASDPFWTKSPLRGKGKIRSFLRVLLEVRRQRYTVAIVPNHCWRSALIAKLLGIPVRIGFGSGKNRLVLTHPVAPMARDQPVVPQMLRLLTPFIDIPRTEAPAFYRLELKEQPQLRRAFERTAPRLVILHPFAGSPKRCAPLPLWVSFARQLKNQGYQILWMGAATELSRLRMTDSSFDSREFADSYEKTGLGDFAGILQQAYAYVGHDSGPLHFAHALGTPVFGLYLPSEFRRTFPQGAHHSFTLYRPSPAELTLNDWLDDWAKFVARV